jgi:predicted DNA-binding ribbon-helix-helix protein
MSAFDEKKLRSSVGGSRGNTAHARASLSWVVAEAHISRRQIGLKPRAACNVAQDLCVKSDRSGEQSMKSPIIKRSIMIASHRTSISLEEPFWRGLKDIAARHETSVQNVVASVHGGRHRGNLSSSLRQFVLEYYRSNCCGKAEGRKAQIMGSHE